MHRHAQGMAVWQWSLPVGFFHGQVQDAQVSRMLFKQCSSVFHRILARRAGQLVDQRLHDESRMTVPHRAQPQHTDAGLRRVKINLMVGHSRQVGTVCHAFDRGFIDAVLDHGRFE
ncbi:hypothetical protein D3C84_1029470 [compost metagenome]